MDTHHGRPSSLLIITRDDLLGRTLDTIFTPAGYQVRRVPDLDDAIQRAVIRVPDAIVLHAEMLRTDPAAICARLRELPELGHRTPLIICSTSPLSAADRRDAFRAGAWHLVETPFDPEDLILRLEVFLQAKHEADEYRDAALRDPETGLYTPDGIQRRAIELAELAARAKEPLACVVLTAAVGTANHDTLREVARTLRERGRRSDAIGTLGHDLFVVVAPATPVAGAARLAERLTEGVTDGLRSHIRAGFDVAAEIDQPSDVVPLLIHHARLAAAEAAKGHAGEWLRKYQGMTQIN